MSNEDLSRLAMAFDNISERQVLQICDTVLTRLRKYLAAFIVDIWIHKPAKDKKECLDRFMRVGGGGSDTDERLIILDKDARGLLVWVAQHKRELLLDNLSPGMTTAHNVYTGELIEERYLDFNTQTRSFAAIPISYRSQNAILSVESMTERGLEQINIKDMEKLKEPVGILIWKASAFSENRRQTDEAIKTFKEAYPKLDKPATYKTGFIARSFQTEYEVLEAAVRGALRQEKIRAETYQHIPGSKLMVTQMLKQIREAYFGIVDVSELNDNVLIELGMMMGSGKKFLLFGKEGTIDKLPFDIRDQMCYEYHVSGSTITVQDTTSVVPVHQIIRRFKDDLVNTNEMFRRAEDWDT